MIWDQIEKQLPNYLTTIQVEKIKLAFETNKKVYISGLEKNDKASSDLANLLNDFGIKCQKINFDDLVLLIREVQQDV